MKKFLPFFGLLFIAGGLRAQNSGALVNQSAFEPPTAVQTQYFYDGNNAVQYICRAAQISDVTSVSIAGATLTSIVVATNVATVTTVAAHNLYIGARVQTTGSATSALNSVYTIATVPTSTTYTFTTSGVGDATYTDAGLKISTSNPLLSSAVWSIQVYLNNGPSNAVTSSYFAVSSVGLSKASFTPRNLACSSRASY